MKKTDNKPAGMKTKIYKVIGKFSLVCFLKSKKAEQTAAGNQSILL